MCYERRGGGGEGVNIAYEIQNIQKINDNGRSLLSNNLTYAITILENCNIVHNHINAHIVMHTLCCVCKRQ